MAHALRYVRKGRADIIGDKLVFRETDHRHISAVRAARPRYFNGEGMATLDAVKGLPVAGPVIKLFTGKRPPAGSLRDYGDPVEISVRAMPLESVTAPVLEWPAPRQRPLAAAATA